MGLGRTSMRLSHLTLATPYQPGAINRRGKPRSTVLTFGWPISQPLNCPNVEAQMSVSDAVDGSHHRADAAAAAEDIGAQVAPLLREAGVGRGAEIFPRRRLAALRANRRFHIFVNAPNESVH